MCVMYQCLILSLLMMNYVDLAWSYALSNIQLDKPLIKSNAVRIIGGVEVKEHSLPYQAALIIDGNIFCGGAIISVRYILTAAHCTYNARHVEAILGAHKWMAKEPTQHIYISTNIINHQKFKSRGIQENDISLVKVGPMFLTNHIKPIQLADSGSGDFVGNQVVLSGWGATSDESDLASGLRKVYLTVAKIKYCQSFYSEFKINSSQLCTKEYDSLSGPVGGCYGDSGGPLVKDNELIGILPFGGSQCISRKPSVYTRVTAYREWILIHSGI